MTDLIMYEMDEHVIKRVFFSLRFPMFLLKVKNHEPIFRKWCASLAGS